MPYQIAIASSLHDNNSSTATATAVHAFAPPSLLAARIKSIQPRKNVAKCKISFLGNTSMMPEGDKWRRAECWDNCGEDMSINILYDEYSM